MIVSEKPPSTKIYQKHKSQPVNQDLQYGTEKHPLWWTKASLYNHGNQYCHNSDKKIVATVAMTTRINVNHLKFCWPWKISSSCPSIVWGQVHLSARFIAVAARTASSNKQALFGGEKIAQLVDIETCSPSLVTKLETQCCDLGVAMSGREPRYLPSESYLGQKEDGDN